METIQVDILNPKAKKLINDLADLNLIAIQHSPAQKFSDVLKKLRSRVDTPPDPEEIAQEVEAVRSERYNH
jgi:predicted RecB family endonuclease